MLTASEHVKTLLPSLAMLHGLTGWGAERATFSIVLSQLISEGLRIQHSPWRCMLVLADDVAPKTLPVSERVERAF